jgi:hypothetical protein
MDPVSKAFIAAMDAFAKREGIPMVHFRKEQRKDDIAAEHVANFTQQEGVLFIGKAQERRRCSARNGGAMRLPALPIPGWLGRPPW